MTMINLELLVGRPVYSQSGVKIGHIETIQAERDGDGFVITEFHVGVYAALERLSASSIGVAILNLLRLRGPNEGYCIPWDKLDLSDCGRLRLLCAKEKLPELK